MEKDNDILGLLEGENTEVIVERDAGLMQWEHDRIIVHRTTFKRMLAIGQKDFPGMWALYGFYFNKAREDETNQPWALDKYCMKGLGWCKDKFYIYKLLLLEHEFITQIVRRNEKGQYRKGEKGKSGAYFIRVNHMNTTTSVQCPEKPDRGKNRIEVKPVTSALTKEREVLKQKNDNVTLEIVSSFNTLKIPNKDRTVWLNQHKDNLGYLLKQLRYAIGKRDIKNIVKWLQSALDGDYAGCDNEAIEARELSAETDKERENNEASALSREAGVALETGGQFDERADSLIKTLNRLLVEREGKTDIVSLCKELKRELESGKNSDEVEDRFFAELIPLMKRQSVRT